MATELAPLALALPLLAAAAAAWCWLRERERARRVPRRALPPAPGPVLLRGRVDLPETEAAIAVEIEQRGEDVRVGRGAATRWRARWRETTRRLRARPFELVLDDGARVRVVPDDRTTLVAGLGAPEDIERRRRIRLAAVHGGELVTVEGRLVALAAEAYRETAALPEIVPPPRGGLRVTRRDEREDHLRRARRHRDWTLILVCSVAAGATALQAWPRSTVGVAIAGLLLSLVFVSESRKDLPWHRLGRVVDEEDAPLPWPSPRSPSDADRA